MEPIETKLNLATAPVDTPIGENFSLPEYASAQWYAGLQYIYLLHSLNQQVDKRDYLLDCSVHSYELDNKLNQAYGNYSNL